MGTIAVDQGQVRDMLNENERLKAQVTELQEANNREVERKRDYKHHVTVLRNELRSLLVSEPDVFAIHKQDIARLIDLEPERPK